MRQIHLIIFLSILSLNSFSQKKKEIKKRGIKSITITDVNNTKTVPATETSGVKSITDSKALYNSNGELIEEWNYNKEGNLKSITKYKYNSDGDVTEEQEFDDKNVLKEKRIISYNSMGEKTAESVSDKDGKLFKKYVYIYDAKGLKTERKAYDGNGVLLSTKKYTYTYK